MDIVSNSVDRLVSIGYSDADAWRIVKDFLKNYYGSKELIEFIEEKEKENVDKVQQQSTCGKCGGLCHKGGEPCPKCKLG
jgi:hypothetical protein